MFVVYAVQASFSLKKTLKIILFLKNQTPFEMQHYHVWIYLGEFKLYAIITLTQHQESILNLLVDQLELLTNLILMLLEFHMNNSKKLLTFYHSLPKS